MRVLLDSNILARHSQPKHALHIPVVRSIESLSIAGNELRTVPQVLYEYWAVATRPLKDNGLDLTIEETHERVVGFKRFFPLIRDERGIYEPWEILVRKLRVQGKPTHDARLAAAMQRHGLTHILTFNGVHFKRFPGINILEPERVASA